MRTLELPKLLPATGTETIELSDFAQPVSDLSLERQRRRGSPDNHSLLYPKRYWHGDPVLRQLAKQATLQCLISPGQHDRLHREVPLVPPLPEPSAAFVLNYFEAENTSPPAESAERLIRLIRASRYEGNDLSAIEKKVVDLSIEALQRQIKYLPNRS